MMVPHKTLAACAAVLLTAATAAGREWSDSTGKYKVDADLIAFNDEVVILKKENKSLISVPIAKLSSQDQAYVKSQEAAERVHQSADKKQIWTLQSGLKVEGRVVNYGRKDVTIQRRRGKIYVGDQLFDNLPEVYRQMVPKIVAYFEKTGELDKQHFETWVNKQVGQPRTFTCDGVLLELANGDEYGVPLFLFSEDDQKLLKPGWDRWWAAQEDKDRREQESFNVQALAQAYQQDRQVSQQIAMLQLQTQAYQAGLFDLWEVQLMPGPGLRAPPLIVVVPGRDSRDASFQAMQRNPGYVAGAAVRVRRR
jgi:hypothetical protein